MSSSSFSSSLTQRREATAAKSNSKRLCPSQQQPNFERPTFTLSHAKSASGSPVVAINDDAPQSGTAPRSPTAARSLSAAVPSAGRHATPPLASSSSNTTPRVPHHTPAWREQQRSLLAGHHKKQAEAQVRRWQADAIATLSITDRRWMLAAMVSESFRYKQLLCEQNGHHSGTLQSSTTSCWQPQLDKSLVTVSDYLELMQDIDVITNLVAQQTVEVASNSCAAPAVVAAAVRRQKAQTLWEHCSGELSRMQLWR